VAEANERKSIDALVARLVNIYPAVSPARIADVVRDEHAHFDDRPLREFVPLFVERRAKRELSLLSA
jgi:hypothetical protein